MLRCIGLSKTFEKNLFNEFDLDLDAGQISCNNWTKWLWENYSVAVHLRIRGTLDEGQILLDGVDVTKMLPEERGIGMIFQRPVLYPTSQC